MVSPRISRIEIYKTSIDFIEPFRIAIGEIKQGNGLAVRIHTDNGLVGTGEGAPYSFITGETQQTCFEVANAFANILLGRNPLAIEARIREMDSFIVHNSTTKCAFDNALFDVLAKHAGLPLYALLGGEKETLITDFTIGIGSPEKMAARAVEYMQEGAQSIKVKLGTTYHDDFERIKAIRATVGWDVDLRIDANQGWDTFTAIKTLKALEKFNIDFCEEPVKCWNNWGLKEVHENSPIPIMADESIFNHHDAIRLASMRACAYFNIKLAKSGGIYNGLKINAIGEGAGIACMVGGMFETRVGISASSHLISARNNICFADLDSIHHYAFDPVIGGVTFDGCKVTLPDVPGIGAEFDPAFLLEMEHVTIE
jgi:L-alanine-DL-glutamate epimerase-like enolase superfamily enzyme